MPEARRQWSGATIFVPTPTEQINAENIKAIQQEREQAQRLTEELKKELAEVRKLKESLQGKSLVSD